MGVKILNIEFLFCAQNIAFSSHSPSVAPYFVDAKEHFDETFTSCRKKIIYKREMKIGSLFLVAKLLLSLHWAT
jgi:hypothetical protein